MMKSLVNSKGGSWHRGAGAMAVAVCVVACGGGEGKDDEADGETPRIDFEDPPGAEVDLTGLVAVATSSVLVFNSVGDRYDDGRTVWLEGSAEGAVVEGLTSSTTPRVSPDGRHYILGGVADSSSPMSVMHVTEGGFTPPRELTGQVFFAGFGGSVDWSRDSRFLVGWGSANVKDGEHIGVYDVLSEREWAQIPVRDTGSLSGIVGGMISYKGDRELSDTAVVALSDAGLTEPLVESDTVRYQRAEDGSLWRLDEANGEVSRAGRFGASFEVIDTLDGADRLLAIPDGSGAYVETDAGAVYFVGNSGPAEEVLSGVSSFGFEVINGGLFVSMQDGRRLFLDRVGTAELDPEVTGLIPVRDTHVIGSDDAMNWYITGVGDGQASQVALLPSGATSFCNYHQDFGPAEKLAIAFSTPEGRHIAFIDLSSREAQLVGTMDASPENTFSCPIFSLDGQSVAFLESTETGGTVWKVDWTSTPGTPEVIFTSDTFVDIVAMN